MSKRAKIEIGKKYYEFTVISEVRKDGKLIGRLCKCSCGKEKVIKNFSTVISGRSTSCGCKRSELLKTNNPMFNEDVRNKVSETMKASASQQELLRQASKKAWTKEAREKRINTCLEKYGSNHHTQHPSVKNKARETNLQKYGSPSPSGNPNIIEKIKKTNMDRFGAENWMSNPENAKLVGKKVRQARRNKGLQTLKDGRPLVDVCKEHGVLPTSARNIIKKRGEDIFYAWLNRDIKSQSSLELDVVQRFKEAGLRADIYNKIPLKLKNNNCRYKPDIIIRGDKSSIYVDIDGLYFHSEKRKIDSAYHLKKQKAFKLAGLPYLQIRQDECYGDSLGIVMNMLTSRLGSNTRIFARSTKAQIVGAKTATDFYKDNHLMGAHRTSKSIALFHKGEIVMMLSYRKVKGTIDLSRVASKGGHTIVGGLSKLLSKIDLKGVEMIQSFVDLRYADGHSLIKNGFKLQSVTLGWKWTDGKFTYDRSFCKANMDGRELTEKEHASEMKLYKIYDAGQAKYVKRVNQ